MIKIDKTLSEQEIILTLSELTTIESPNYLMVITADVDGGVFKFFLPENISPAKIRYDLFKLDNSVFKDLNTGGYSYSVYQSEFNFEGTDESTLGEVIEKGKLKIIGKVIEKEIITPIRTNEYIIYK